MKGKSNMKTRFIKTLAAVLAMLLIIFASPTYTAFANGIAVLFNDTEIQFSQPPIERHGFLFHPLEDILEAIGATWTADRLNIRGELNGNTLHVPTGNLRYNVNGARFQVPRELEPIIYNDVVYVYIDVIIDAFGMSSSWDGGTRSLVITNWITPINR